MSHCVAINCSSHSSKNESGVAFHKFPQDVNLRRKWILAVGRKNWSPTNQSKICSKHFTEDQIVRYDSKVSLKIGVVPCVFQGYPSYSEQVKKAPCKYKASSVEDGNFSDVSVSSFSCDIASSGKEIGELSQNTSVSFEEIIGKECDNPLADEEINEAPVRKDIPTSPSKTTDTVSFANLLPSEEAGSLSNETSSFVSKVANILHSHSAATVEVNALPPNASLQLIQTLFSPLTAQRKIDFENDIPKQYLKNKIRRASEMRKKYRRKLDIYKQTVSCQMKKIKILQHLTSSIKKEKIFEED